MFLIEAILDFLESLRNSLQFAYKICLQEVCEEGEKCVLIFGSDADFLENSAYGNSEPVPLQG